MTGILVSSNGFAVVGSGGGAIGVAGAADSTPDAFTFTDLTNQTQSATVTSNIITPTGFNQDIAITISGAASGRYRIDGGSWTAASGTFSAGSTVQLQVETSASESTEVTVTLTIGGVSDTWNVTTGTASASTDAAWGWENETGGAVSGEYLWHPVMFPEGAVPSGQKLVAKVGGSPITCSTLNHATWADGSLRYALACYKQPSSLNDTESLSVTFEKASGTQTGWQGASISSILAGIDAEVQISGDLSGTVTLADAVSNWSFTWDSQETCFIVECWDYLGSTDVRVCFWVWYWSDGEYIIVPQINNGHDEQDNSLDEHVLDIDFYVDDVEELSYADCTICHHSGALILDADGMPWCSAGQPRTLTTKPSRRMLSTAGFMPPLNTEGDDAITISSIPATPGVVFSGHGGTAHDNISFHPTDNNYAEQELGRPGYYPEIGFLPLYTNYFLLKQNDNWEKYTRLRSLNYFHMPWKWSSVKGGGTKYSMINTSPDQAPWDNLHSQFATETDDFRRPDCYVSVTTNGGAGQNGWTMNSAYGKSSLNFSHYCGAIGGMCAIDGAPWFVDRQIYSVAFAVADNDTEYDRGSNGNDDAAIDQNREWLIGLDGQEEWKYSTFAWQEERELAWEIRETGWARYVCPDNNINKAFVDVWHDQMWDILDFCMSNEESDAYDGRACADDNTLGWWFMPRHFPHSVIAPWQYAYLGITVAVEHHRGWTDTDTFFQKHCETWWATLMGNHTYAATSYRMRFEPSGDRNRSHQGTVFANFDYATDSQMQFSSSTFGDGSSAYPVDYPAETSGYLDDYNNGGPLSPWFTWRKPEGYAVNCTAAIKAIIWARGGTTGNANLAAAETWYYANEPWDLHQAGEPFEDNHISGCNWRFQITDEAA